jgi:drug/metabolite transporter (DMT)-like permease
MNPQRSGDWFAYLLLLIAPLCWAGNIVLARGVVDMIPPVSFAFWRWTVAFLLLLPFTRRTVMKDWAVARQQWKILTAISFLGISCFNTLLYTAVHSTTAINGALIQSTMPAVIIVICRILYGERVTKRQLFGVAACVLGAGLVVMRGDARALVDLALVRGDVLMVVAVIIYATYSSLLKRRPAIHPMSFLVITFGIGAAGLAPLYGWEILTAGPFALTWRTASSILYVAVFPSILAYFCWNSGIDRIGPSRGGLFINFIPVFTAVMAVFMLGESLRWFHITGMGLILGGMIVFNRRHDQRR